MKNVSRHNFNVKFYLFKLYLNNCAPNLAIDTKMQLKLIVSKL